MKNDIMEGGEMRSQRLLDAQYNMLSNVTSIATMSDGFVPYVGKTCPKTGASSVEILHRVAEGFLTLHKQFPLICGIHDKHVNERHQHEYFRAVRDSVFDSFGLSKWTVIAGLALLVIGGPFAFLVGVITFGFEYFLGKDIAGDQQVRMAVAAFA